MRRLYLLILIGLGALKCQGQRLSCKDILKLENEEQRLDWIGRNWTACGSNQGWVKKASRTIDASLDTNRPSVTLIRLEGWLENTPLRDDAKTAAGEAIIREGEQVAFGDKDGIVAQISKLRLYQDWFIQPAQSARRERQMDRLQTDLFNFAATRSWWDMEQLKAYFSNPKTDADYPKEMHRQLVAASVRSNDLKELEIVCPRLSDPLEHSACDGRVRNLRAEQKLTEIRGNGLDCEVLARQKEFFRGTSAWTGYLSILDGCANSLYPSKAVCAAIETPEARKSCEVKLCQWTGTSATRAYDNGSLKWDSIDAFKDACQGQPVYTTAQQLEWRFAAREAVDRWRSQEINSADPLNSKQYSKQAWGELWAALDVSAKAKFGARLEDLAPDSYALIKQSYYQAEQRSEQIARTAGTQWNELQSRLDQARANANSWNEWNKASDGVLHLADYALLLDSTQQWPAQTRNAILNAKRNIGVQLAEGQITNQPDQTPAAAPVNWCRVAMDSRVKEIVTAVIPNLPLKLLLVVGWNLITPDMICPK